MKKIVDAREKLLKYYNRREHSIDLATCNPKDFTEEQIKKEFNIDSKELFIRVIYEIHASLHVYVGRYFKTFDKKIKQDIKKIQEEINKLL
jgi:hypothetical protein